MHRKSLEASRACSTVFPTYKWKMSLFASGNAQGAPAAAAVSDHAVEFKAGKMEMRGSTVTALPAKGLIYLKKVSKRLATL